MLWILICLKAQKTDVKTVIQRERIQQRFIQSENNLQKKIQREASVQTEWV